MSRVLSCVMTTETLIAPTRAERERDTVTSWRVERLLDAGYDGEASLVLALDRDVDLHLRRLAPRARLPRGHRASDSVLARQAGLGGAESCG